MTDADTRPVVSRLALAQEQFRELSGLEPVTVSALSRIDGGWQLDIDVVEVVRVPDTANLMATYRVTTDDAGQVSGYERIRRYTRGEADRPA